MELCANANAPDRMHYRPSRTNYPGSRFGPKTRYDLPQRHRSYGNGDQAEAILFSGTSLQPQAWKPGLDTDVALGGQMQLFPNRTSPRESAALTDAARLMLHPLSDRNLPDLPLPDDKSDVHGSIILGGKESGKTTLILSLVSLATGIYPSKKDTEIEEKRRSMPAFGQSYELPEREIRLGGPGSSNSQSMRVILTDTPACGTQQREEQPLCATVSPNSTQHYNAIPSWMRIAMRGGNISHYAVLFVVDALAVPLWEDSERCRDLARLLAVLKRNQYTVVIAVTKLLRAREIALRETAHGHDHKGQVGKDPRSSYEAFVGRYLEKVCASLQAKACENDWSFSQGPDIPSFPLVNHTIFDAPTWVSITDWRKWQDKKGTPELPNLKYIRSQLERILTALSVRPRFE